MESTDKRIRIEYYLPFYLVLTQYKVGIITVGDIILILIAGIYIWRNNGRLGIRRDCYHYLMLFVYILFRDIITACIGFTDGSLVFHRMVSYTVLFLTMFAVTSGTFDEEKLYKAWKIAGLIYTAGLLYHVFCVFILGQKVSTITLFGSPLGIPTSRPKSFFIEPASFSNAMIPLLVIALNRRDYKVSVLATLACLLSTSTTSAILAGILWVLYLFNREIKISRKVFISITIIALVVVYSEMSVFSDSYYKFTDVLEGESTFGARVSCGLEIAQSQDPLQKVFGTLYADTNSYVTDNYSKFNQSSSVVKYYSIHESVYSNTFGLIMNKYGGIGFILLLCTIIPFLKEKNYEIKGYAISFIIALFGQGILFNGYYFMINIILLLYQKKWSETICLCTDHPNN